MFVLEGSTKVHWTTMSLVYIMGHCHYKLEFGDPNLRRL
jgi:hypothetical protein